MPAQAKRTTTTKSRRKPAPSATTAGAINIRVRDDDRALIDQGASLAGKSRSEFMLEAARHAATEAILDRTLFRIQPSVFAKFVAMLDAKPQPNERLRKLMQTKAPWE
jgi:uncharacterized protein (DUF1778 family)